MRACLLVDSMFLPRGRRTNRFCQVVVSIPLSAHRLSPPDVFACMRVGKENGLDGLAHRHYLDRDVPSFFDWSTSRSMVASFDRDCVGLIMLYTHENVCVCPSGATGIINHAVRRNRQVAYGSREWKAARKTLLLQEEAAEAAAAAASSGEANPSLPRGQSNNHGGRMGDHGGGDGGGDGGGVIPAKGGGPGRVVSSAGARISKLNFSLKASKSKVI